MHINPQKVGWGVTRVASGRQQQPSRALHDEERGLHKETGLRENVCDLNLAGAYRSIPLRKHQIMHSKECSRQREWLVQRPRSEKNRRADCF